MAITSNKKAAALDPSQVADFLSNNPEFFEDRDALLLSMSLPHQQGGAVSLVEKQVALLRERNLETKKRLDEFVRAAKITTQFSFDVSVLSYRCWTLKRRMNFSKH
jgi:uncharacterized protein YigA (DUF484 family)